MSKTLNPSEEAQLTARLSSPDTRRAAFTQLVEIYQEQLYWQIRKLLISHDDTADVLQNTFLKAWSNLDNFRGDAKISTWLYTIAHNESVTFLQKRQAELDMTQSDPEGYLMDQLQADRYFDGDETQRTLLMAIATLPAKQRQVFNMRYFDDMPYEQISEILDTSVGALKASYHFAAEKIADYFHRHEL